MLVGRGRELAWLDGHAERARCGAGGVVAIVGEAGIGKSRLAAELATRMGERGMHVHWGRAWETGGAPAYWPWIEILRSIRARQPDLAVPPVVAALLERERWQGRGDTVLADASEARFALSEAVAETVREAATRSPLLLMLDDLHAADVPSIELTHFIARGLAGTPALIVAMWRDAEGQRPPVAESIGRVARQAQRLAPRPFAIADIAELLDEHGRRYAGEIHRKTDGNPLLVEEAIRLVTTGGALARLPASPGIGLILRERTAGLPAGVLAIAAAAAVIGRDVPIALLAEISDRPRDEVEHGLDLLAGADLLRRHDAVWRFTHVLVREALYGELAPAVRRELHARVLAALDRKLGIGDEALATAAHHALLAVPIVALERAVELARLASERARAQRAFEDAVALLERARGLLTVDDPLLAAELALALGWAALDAGQHATAQAAFADATAFARRATSAVHLARAALGHGAKFVFGDVRGDLVDLLREAEAALPDSEVLFRARVRARLAAALVPARDVRPALALARAAVRAVADHPDDRAVLDVVVSAGSALADFADPLERIPVNLELVHRARRIGDRVLELRGLSRLVTDHLEAGEVALADATLAIRDELAPQLRMPHYQWQAPLFRSMRAMIEARFDDCRLAIDEATALGIEIDDDNLRRCIAVHRTWVLLLEDDIAALTAHLPELGRGAGTMAGGPYVLAMLTALVHVRRGDIAAARSALDQIPDDTLGLLEAPPLMATLGEAVAGAGDLVRARVIRDRLAAAANRNATFGLFGLVCMPQVTATLGLLDAALGDVASADAHFRSAAERARVMRAPAHQAWVALWWALAVPSARAERLAEAETVATGAGMHHLVARIRTARGERAPAVYVPRRLAFTLTQAGDGWLVERGGRTTKLRALRGLAMLAMLVAQPDREIHATELVGGGDDGDAGDVIDERARATYRARLATLREELEDAQARGLTERAERAHEEIEQLSRELARAVGLGGRLRRAGSVAERARISVQRRMREAIRKIADVDAELGRHLDWAIRTGTFCVYAPDGTM